MEGKVKKSGHLCADLLKKGEPWTRVGGNPTSSSLQLSSGTKSITNLVAPENLFVAGLEPAQSRNAPLQS